MKKAKSCIPLEEIRITVVNSKTDELEEISALHPSNCKHSLCDSTYIKVNIETDNDVELCLNMLDNLISCLHWLLSLRYEKFWCQVVNDKSVHTCLDSYLRYAPRYYQPHWPEEVAQKHNTLHRAVFMAFLRMSTLKESEKHFMGKNLFLKLIYDNYLFDIPRLMDICSLYGSPENRPLLKKMLENVFHSQPKFYDDLNQAAETVSQVLLQIEEKCMGLQDDGLPNKLTDGCMSSSLQKMSKEEFADVIFYISDTTRTLQSFIVDVFNEAAKPFYEKNLVDRLIALYNDVLPAIRDTLGAQERTLGGALYFELRSHVRQSRDCLMNVINCIIQNHVYLPAVAAAKDNSMEEAEELAETYFQVLSFFLTNQRFFDDFCSRFDTKNDVYNLTKVCPSVGEAHSQFLFNTPYLNSEEVQAMPAGSGSYNDDMPTTSKASDMQQLNNANDAEMTASISSIRDVLPDLEVNFVKRCLAYYELNPEKVIQAILEQNLPPHLTNSSTTNDHDENDEVKHKEIERNSEQPSTSKELDFLHERKNIFDNDEFDVFSKSSHVDKSKVHYGKRDKGQVGHWKSDAEEDVEKLRLLYSRYGLGAEETDNEIMLIRADPVSNYDDEYDDTYDDVAVGANDADSVDEFGDEKEEKEGERPRQPYRSRNFIENPETIRAKDEERRQRREEYFSKRGGKTNKQSRASQQGAKNGQETADGTTNEKNVDRKKREYKQSRGGNNRKMQATKKASRGMFMTS